MAYRWKRKETINVVMYAWFKTQHASTTTSKIKPLGYCAVHHTLTYAHWQFGESFFFFLNESLTLWQLNGSRSTHFIIISIYLIHN